MNIEQTECKNCLLTTVDVKDLTFDDNGVCNYCNSYKKNYEYVIKDKDKQIKLKGLIDRIKLEGKNKEYDCIIGVSGGIDSTYVAYMAKQWGLRPLAVHLDYGWNSELAVDNIKNTLNKLGIDLYTYVVDWREIRDLQLAFLKASVIDIELINDFAIFATLYNQAYKRKVKYVLNGMNIETEGGKLPKGWSHEKFDQLNILSIHKQFGKVRLKTFPKLSYYRRFYLSVIYKLQWVPILNYVDYNKKAAKEKVTNELNWRDYGGKHFESIFTKFYQTYILPTKFKVDKRKFHYSVLICSGQMTKEEALEEIKKPLYDPDKFKEDYEFILKKLEISKEEFDSLMALPQRDHLEFDSYIKSHYPKGSKVVSLITPFSKLVKNISK